MIRELALKNRSYRRFYGEKKIDERDTCGNWWILHGIHRACGKQTAASNTVLCVMMKQTAVYTTVLAGQAIIRTGTVR